MRSIVAALVLTLPLGACLDGDLDIGSSADDLSFEDWRDDLPHMDGVPLVEGDIPIHDEAELRAYFDRVQRANGALTVITDRDTGERLSQPRSVRHQLSYCLSPGFGTRYEEVRAAMDAAAYAWEQVADVTFFHVPAEDADCNASNDRVFFHVTRGFCSGGCSAAAFFPGAARFARALKIDFSYFPLPDQSLTSVLEHELGHILGFTHEHVWDDCTGEGTSRVDQLTHVDRASIMYYAARTCDDAAHDGDPDLTDIDAHGAACRYNQNVPDAICRASGTYDDTLWYGAPGRTFDRRTTWKVGSLWADEAPYATQPVAGDFDGDGKSDVLWYGRGQRRDQIYFGKGTASFLHPWPDPVVDGIFTPVAGDFDGDQRDDIFWYGAGMRPDFMWWSNGGKDSTFDETYMAEGTAGGIYDVHAGDFDGDGVHDLLFQQRTTGRSRILWGSRSRRWAMTQVKHEVDVVPVIGDFNGDGRDDILFYSTLSMFLPSHFYWSDGDRTFTSRAQYMFGGFVAAAGDFDGDGVDDILWYTPGGGHDSVAYYNRNGAATGVAHPQNAYAAPLVADYNGDGRADIFWYAGPEKR